MNNIELFIFPGKLYDESWFNHLEMMFPQLGPEKNQIDILDVSW